MLNTFTEQNMPSINRLTESPIFERGDQLAIYSAIAGRTRSITFDTLKKSLKYVEDLSLNGGVLTVHYSDGSQKELNL